MMSGPLEGIRVADFTWVGAGPFLTKPLADHGADVVKIESRTRLDPIRSARPFMDGVPGLNRSGYFSNRNSSKRSMCIDLKTPTGREVALKLIAQSDVVANNFTPGTMDRLGIGYEDARAVRPDIIYLEMPMQGVDGPYRDHRGYGLTIGAMAGFLGLAGWPDRPPTGTGTNYPDHVPNPLQAATAVLAALRHRRRTGLGSYIEVSQLESTINVLSEALVAHQLGEPGARRQGNVDRHLVPHGVFPCKGTDRWCAIAVETDGQWRELVRLLDAKALDDEFFSTAAGRRDNADLLDEKLARCTRGWDARTLADVLTGGGVAAAVVNDARDLVETDPQLAARQHWVSLEHPEMGASIYDAPPYRLSRTPGSLRSPAPLLGEHTREVCVELLGMPPDEYERLVDEGVLG